MKNILRKVSFYVVLVVSIMVSSYSFSEEKVINLATLDWPPFVIEDSQDQGVSTDIVRTTLERMGYAVNIHFVPWKRCLEDTESGVYDGCYPAYDSEERQVTYAVSDSTLNSRLGFYKRKDSDIVYEKLEDLKSYDIGVVRGYINGPAFDSADYLTKIEGRSDEINIKKLLWKRLDLIVVDELVGKNILNEAFPERVDEVEFLEPPLEVKTLHVLFTRKKDKAEALRDAFNAERDKMQKDGSIDEILRKHGY